MTPNKYNTRSNLLKVNKFMRACGVAEEIVKQKKEIHYFYEETHKYAEGFSADVLINGETYSLNQRYDACNFLDEVNVSLGNCFWEHPDPTSICNDTYYLDKLLYLKLWHADFSIEDSKVKQVMDRLTSLGVDVMPLVEKHTKYYAGVLAEEKKRFALDEEKEMEALRAELATLRNS